MLAVLTRPLERLTEGIKMTAVIVCTVVTLVVLVGALFFVYIRYGAIGVVREKHARDGHLRLPAYNVLTGRWSDDKPAHKAGPQ